MASATPAARDTPAQNTSAATRHLRIPQYYNGPIGTPMDLTRRDLGKLALAALPASMLAAADWKQQPGLELYTVRDLTAKDYEGTIAKVAEIGYKEVEPATDYAGMQPRQFRAMLDRYRLTAPTTHVGATEGPDLENQLEGFQVMGIQYTEVRGAPAQGGRGAGGGGRG